jgi:hypothetical protein
MQTMKPCGVCGREYMGDDAEVCGDECRQALMLFQDNLGKAFATPPSDDRRIFFYDASFGFLVDRWTILLLQRLKTKDIELQKEIDFHMHRIRRCIETKIADRNMAPHERDLISKVSQKILALNGRGWQLRSLAKNKRIDNEARSAAAMQYVDLGDERAREIRQLDLLVNGRTHAWKTY